MIWGHEPSQGWSLLEERGANGELLARYVHGPSVGDIVLSELGGGVYYYHHDHINSTVAVTDSNGSVVEQYRYDAYGQPSFYGPDGAPRAESALAIRFLFTGRDWLSSLALYDYRHRLYSPSLGRFLQMDPLGFEAGEVNVYMYVRNSVLIAADPFGLWFVLLTDHNAVGNQGHAAVITGNDSEGYRYDSYGPSKKQRKGKCGRHGVYYFSTLKEAFDFAKEMGYTDYVRFQTTPEQDRRAREEMDRWHRGRGETYQILKPYDIMENNCQKFVAEAARAANIEDYVKYARETSIRHPNIQQRTLTHTAHDTGEL